MSKKKNRIKVERKKSDDYEKVIISIDDVTIQVDVWDVCNVSFVDIWSETDEEGLMLKFVRKRKKLEFIIQDEYANQTNPFTTKSLLKSLNVEIS